MTAANEQPKNQTIMKLLNQMLSGSITGLIGLFATSVMAADAAQYSSKAALLNPGTESSAVNVKLSAVAQPAYSVSSKSWLWPSRSAGSIATHSESATFLASDYNSKKAVRGEREPVQPVLQIAPLK